MSYPYLFFQTVSDAAKEDILEFIPELKRVLPLRYTTAIVRSLESGILVSLNKSVGYRPFYL